MGTRLLRNAHSLRVLSRSYTTTISSPRHLLSIADLTPHELTTLVLSAHTHKSHVDPLPTQPLRGQTLALLFTKRSTRTRVSTEAALARLGAHPLFLSPGDIQLNVNETLRDTSTVISSMTSGIVARVDAHADVEEMAKWSSVPVLNALSDLAHPLQIIADFLTLYEVFGSSKQPSSTTAPSLGLEGLRLAWIGDTNNVLYDLALASTKLGCHLSIATPPGYTLPPRILEALHATTSSNLPTHTHDPLAALDHADVILTDTWISMGAESEKSRRLREFAGFQVTEELARKGGARNGWKFMHCLPRHAEEVNDEVFYGERSLVFPEAANRLWAAIAAVEGFVVRRGVLG
ncbi:hypothetical protein M433DRAFT_68097 [Acidomyces richmondensis BFW]|nr:MAG: hypothetical protein FE78DRAFT_149883 [Acidomyces sp. 'richmondensis']KYG45074.1 hypothetical protein M433DRAFT_68097 [Acidomyces richmondensis BFW]